LPFSLGTWRPDGIAPAYLVSRYGGLTFVSPQGQLAGVLQPGGYVISDVLSRGVDFDEDGRDEQVCLARGVLLHIQGPPDPRSVSWEGQPDHPEIYHAVQVAEPAWEPDIEGPETLVFQPCSWMSRRMVVVARSNYLGLYDGKLKKWQYQWVSPSRCEAADFACRAGLLRLVVATADQVLWEFDWDSSSLLPRISSRFLSRRVRRLQLTDRGILLVDSRGILVLPTRGQENLVASGDFADAAMVSVQGRPAVLATTQTGDVLRLDYVSP
jgi:hypothetical protein